jgi:hypothetical protein
VYIEKYVETVGSLSINSVSNFQIKIFVLTLQIIIGDESDRGRLTIVPAQTRNFNVCTVLSLINTIWIYAYTDSIIQPPRYPGTN